MFSHLCLLFFWLEWKVSEKSIISPMPDDLSKGTVRPFEDCSYARQANKLRHSFKTRIVFEISNFRIPGTELGQAYNEGI